MIEELIMILGKTFGLIFIVLILLSPALILFGGAELIWQIFGILPQ